MDLLSLYVTERRLVLLSAYITKNCPDVPSICATEMLLVLLSVYVTEDIYIVEGRQVLRSVYIAELYILQSFALSGSPALHLCCLRRTWTPRCFDASGADPRTRLEALELAKSRGPAKNGHGLARPLDGAFPGGGFFASWYA